MLLITNFTLQFRDFAPWTRLCDRPKFGQIRSGFTKVKFRIRMMVLKASQLTYSSTITKRSIDSSHDATENSNHQNWKLSVRISGFGRFGKLGCDRILISVRIFIRRPNAKIRSASSQFWWFQCSIFSRLWFALRFVFVEQSVSRNNLKTIIQMIFFEFSTGRPNMTEFRSLAESNWLPEISKLKCKVRN